MTKKKRLATRKDPLAVTSVPCCGTCSMWTRPDDPDDDPFGECGRARVTTGVLKPIWAGVRRVLQPIDVVEPAERHRPIADFDSIIDYADHVKRRSPPKTPPSVDVRRIDQGECFSRQELLGIDRGIPTEPMRTRSWARACPLYAPHVARRRDWAMFREAMDEWDYWMDGVA